MEDLIVQQHGIQASPAAGILVNNLAIPSGMAGKSLNYSGSMSLTIWSP
jgi:hypothetical protein